MLSHDNPREMATVACAAIPSKEEIMAKFNVTVSPFKNAQKPHLKFVVNVYHPTKGRQRFFRATQEEANSLLLPSESRPKTSA